MSHYWTALAMKQKGLQPSTKIVLYWLADHHNGVSGLCIPSQKRLETFAKCQTEASETFNRFGRLGTHRNNRKKGQMALKLQPISLII